jgi:hypothetical protein
MKTFHRDFVLSLIPYQFLKIYKLRLIKVINVLPGSRISGQSRINRSHRIDQEGFYQLLTYTDDVDLNKKLVYWERFYNFDRPHGSFEGIISYEKMRSL